MNPSLNIADTIAAFDIRNLKRQVTRVTTRSGQIFEEVRRRDGEGGVDRVFVGQGPVPRFFEDCMNGYSEIECQFYNKENRKWEAASGLVSKGVVADSTCDMLKLVSYNVWFSEKNWENRAQALLQIVEAQNADIVCLQEVTQHFLEKVLQAPWIRANYVVTDARGSTTTPYGVLMIIRSSLKVVQSRLYDLPTNMGRRFLLCELELNSGEKASVGTVHLESLNNAEIREAQLARILDVTSIASHLIIAGDFNFHDTMPENRVLLPALTDSWAAARSSGAAARSRNGTLIDRVVHRSAAVRVSHGARPSRRRTQSDSATVPGPSEDS